MFLFVIECDPLYNTTSEAVYVDPVQHVGALALSYCKYGYKSDSEPLLLECEDSLFWNSSALNCSQRICPGEYVTKVCYNCGDNGFDPKYFEDVLEVSEAECKNLIYNFDQFSVIFDPIYKQCFVWQSEVTEFASFEADMMYMWNSCNAGEVG